MSISIILNKIDKNTPVEKKLEALQDFYKIKFEINKLCVNAVKMIS